MRLFSWLLTTWSGVRISPQEPIKKRVRRDASLFLIVKPCYKRLPCKPFVSKVLESSISQKSCPQTVLGLSLRVSTHSALSGCLCSASGIIAPRTQIHPERFSGVKMTPKLSLTASSHYVFIMGKNREEVKA